MHKATPLPLTKYHVHHAHAHTHTHEYSNIGMRSLNTRYTPLGMPSTTTRCTPPLHSAPTLSQHPMHYFLDNVKRYNLHLTP